MPNYSFVTETMCFQNYTYVIEDIQDQCGLLNIRLSQHKWLYMNCFSSYSKVNGEKKDLLESNSSGLFRPNVHRNEMDHSLEAAISLL